PALQELCDQSVKSKSPVIGRKMNTCAGALKILDACRQVDSSNAIIQGHLGCRLSWHFSAVTAFAKKLADVGQEWRLPDAARDQSDMINIRQLGKAVAQRAPDIH